MDLHSLAESAAAFTGNSPLNVVCLEDGPLTMYEAPLLAAADADDPLFAKVKEAIGPHFMLPCEWLENARSVVSFFAPFTPRVRRSNTETQGLPSAEWLYARIEGHEFIGAMGRHLADELEREGQACVVPMLDGRFCSQTGMPRLHTGEDPNGPFTSNWSERHAAYVCGLGTFGLSRGLITRRGVAGRFCSLVTALPLPPTPRGYTGIYDYCSRCGVCAIRCPVDAISPEDGKNHVPCAAYCDFMYEKFHPRYGCGKCQTGVPCESGIPPKRA